MAAHIERVVTSAPAGPDGGAGKESNIWVVGDDDQVMVIDAAHDVGRITTAVGGRHVSAIACTHGHSNHVNQAPALAAAVGAPTMLHRSDQPLWDQACPGTVPDLELAEREALRVATVEVRVLHTPGHTPGSVSLYVPALDAVFSGDTLAARGPGSTAADDFPIIITSIHDKLFGLPPRTTVYPGHGEPTTIKDQAPYLEEWVGTRSGG
jgi:glyoxylase-like metal-dependent hydrolase (beta-lactamase superfamily II)